MSTATPARIISLTLYGAGSKADGTPAVRSPVATDYEIPEHLAIHDDPTEPTPTGRRAFRVLTPADGDKRVTWDPTSFLEIKEAEKMFNDLVEKGLVPHRVGNGGKASPEVMDQFDPHAEEVIFVPIAAAVGG